MRAKLSTLFIALLFLVNTHALAQEPETKTFTTDDKSFSFVYPADWSVEVVNADLGPDAHLSVDNLPLDTRFDSPDGVNLQISLPAKSYQVSLFGGKTPKDAVALSVRGRSTPVSIDFGTPSADKMPEPLQLQPSSPNVKEFTVGGRPAAYAYSTMQVAGVDYSQLIIIADLGNDYWVVTNASSFRGGLKTLQRKEATILAIVQTMRYTPPPAAYSGHPDLPRVYSGLVGIWQRGYIKFYYPKDWYAYRFVTVLITNKAGGVANAQPESGQFIAVVLGVSETRASADPTALFDECSTSKSDLTARKLVEKLLGNVTAAQFEELKRAGITVTQPEVTTVNGKEIVYLRQYQNDLEVLTMYIDLGEGNIPSMSITAKQGEMAQFEKQLFAVAGTFQYTPKPCQQQEIPATATPQQ